MAKRIAIIEQDKCNPHKCGNYLCIRLCPVNRDGEECISRNEEKQKAIIDEKLCTGCGICPLRCPFGAIHIINLPEKLNQEPLHRYGKNLFELFSVPVIKQGAVVGVLGRNGIGKSSAFEILSGRFIPNNGDFLQSSDELAQQGILTRFANTQMGDYFKKLYAGKLNIAYKPQRVELLAKHSKGTVSELLTKVDERKEAANLMEELDLTQLKNRKLDELSGGELQKVAIVATLVKDADVYYFDEPSSFLDITSRIKVARLISGLKERNAAVMVVDHDLATLDYISDEIQIMYGERACYGVISVSKGVRNGINDYLQGYLPDDNVRFRDYAINFTRGVQLRNENAEALLSYKNIKKSFSEFSMEINEGVINRGEVLGIMGSNGLGKSTFLKIISGELEKDSGELTQEGEEKLKISYKPQYPSIEEDVTVEVYLKHHAGAEMNSGWYQQNILEKLGIQNILQNPMSNLSGGELQKVFVAGCLSGEADLLVLDEPSAFIDVEDRINIAEVIKEFTQRKHIACVVVDHDVQFMDYLADTMLVFEGESGKRGEVFGPCDKNEGMNRVLKMLEITYRKDKDSNRARINKPDSQLDKEQRSKGQYYYI